VHKGLKVKPYLVKAILIVPSHRWGRSFAARLHSLLINEHTTTPNTTTITNSTLSQVAITPYK